MLPRRRPAARTAHRPTTLGTRRGPGAAVRQAGEVLPQGQQEIRGRGEGEDRLGFLPSQPDHAVGPVPCRDGSQASEQGGLAHPGLADEHHRAARRIQRIDPGRERFLLGHPPDQSLRPMPGRIACRLASGTPSPPDATPWQCTGNKLLYSLFYLSHIS